MCSDAFKKKASLQLHNNNFSVFATNNFFIYSNIIITVVDFDSGLFK